jgi:hypothetical protein
MLTLVAAAWLPVSRFTRASLAGELLAGPAATASASSQRVRQTLLALHTGVLDFDGPGLTARVTPH